MNAKTTILCLALLISGPAFGQSAIQQWWCQLYVRVQGSQQGIMERECEISRPVEPTRYASAPPVPVEPPPRHVVVPPLPVEPPPRYFVGPLLPDERGGVRYGTPIPVVWPSYHARVPTEPIVRNGRKPGVHVR